MAVEKLTQKSKAWFCINGLKSDVVIEIGDMSYHLHKFPLLSKSRRIRRMVTEREEIGEGELRRIVWPEFPGGPEAFEAVAKFCYGAKIELTAWNAAPVLCAAAYLEMTEDFEEGNLIGRAERFLSQTILRNFRDAVKVLKSCEPLAPLVEELGIPRRCIDSIAARACTADLSSLLGLHANDSPASDDRKPTPIAAAVLWNGIDTGMRRKNGIRSSTVAGAGVVDSLFEDLTILNPATYMRVISAIRSRDPGSEVIEGSLISYARSSIPGLSRSDHRHSSAPLASEAEQRELLETVISNLPMEKSSSLMSPRFLFGLLRTANILRASDTSRSALEIKIARQLQKATAVDLLMPSYSYAIDTLYDVDCVERIVGYFMEARGNEGSTDHVDGEGVSELLAVGKLLDAYLAEIASDSNLKADKFLEIAAVLPEEARLYDDGLYRAVDIYLKAHPEMEEKEREKVCTAMDCQKLTLEACTHAAQNERLPLRVVVQVLFFEQIQLRRAVAGTIVATTPDRPAASRSELVGAQGAGERNTWPAAVRENQVLKLDMDSVRGRVHQLERECTRMKRALEKIHRGTTAGGGGGSSSPVRSRGLGSLTRRLGCRFGSQVCDAQGSTVVDSRKPRTSGHSS